MFSLFRNGFFGFVTLGVMQAQAALPNVVLFVVDDFGAHDLGYTGSAVYETPRIDRLALAGARFTQAYAAYPRCVPSRFGLMTGVHPSRAEGEGEQLGLMDPDRVTLAEALKAQGYRTFFAGKWHLGKDEATFPQGQGFDVNIGGGSAGAPGSYFAPFKGNSDLSGPDALSVVPGEYLTDRLTEATVRYLREGGPDAVPFFICLSHYAVHTPLQAKAANTTHFATKIETLGYAVGQTEVTADGRHLVEQSNATYAAMIKSVDESLGRIVDALQQLGLYEDTIIVLTSDHGGLSNCGPDRNRELATTNAPLRAGKGHLYEGGLRVPLLVRWPGVTHAGDQIGQPVVGLDIYPSILQMAGLPLRPQDHQDGVSFAPLLQGESPTTDRAFYWYSDRGRRDSTGDRNAAVVRQGDYKLVEFFTEKRVELYNLRDDVGETRNLIDAEPAVGGRLLADLAQWKRTMKVKDRKQERSRAGENYPY